MKLALLISMTVLTLAGWAWYLRPEKKPTGPFSVAELSPAERAMDGISDPEQFMADVRAAIADWESGQVAGSDHRDRYMARLAAQLKGE